MNRDFRELLLAFNDESVEYLPVGAHALAVYALHPKLGIPPTAVVDSSSPYYLSGAVEKCRAKRAGGLEKNAWAEKTLLSILRRANARQDSLSLCL